MKNLFVRLSCGCVVIPLGLPGRTEKFESTVTVIPCDNPDEPSVRFYLRDQEVVKISQGRPLTEAESKILIKKISLLIDTGHQAMGLSRLLKNIDSQQALYNHSGADYFPEKLSGESPYGGPDY